MNNESAFPWNLNRTNKDIVEHEGMTLLDYFAGQANESDIESVMSESVPGRTIDRIEARYIFASRMLSERVKVNHE